MSRRRALRAALALGAALALSALAAGSWLYVVIHRAQAGWDGAAVVVDLEPGLDATAMLERLHEAGVVSHPRLLRAWLAWRGGAERLHAGEYRFDRPVSAREVLRRLRKGDVVLHAVTLPEGLTLDEVAVRLAQAGFGSEVGLLEALSDPTPIRELDPDAPTLEGYLFPDTYQFPRGERPARIAAAMVTRFRQVTGPGFAREAEAVGLDLRQAVTLASLIEKETSLGEERPRISRVFHNRLERGMRLECDPTVLYALRRAGQPVERLTYAHLRIESPWNTYRRTGLPPSPIANPGGDSLRAAVRPAPGDELYFVAAPGGGHRFSPNMAAHLEAVAEWRRYQRSSR